ncbi:hypothetical protein U1Q18_001403, partial [Sarracenia purpurea var. burkii]
MIGHVESGEISVGVVEHGFDSVVSIDSFPSVAHLPHPVPMFFLFEINDEWNSIALNYTLGTTSEPKG